MMTGKHWLRRDGTVKSLGIDYGGKVTLVFRAGNFIVVRNKGSMCWSGIGSQEYARSEWSLLRVELPEEVQAEGPPWYEVEPENWNGLPFEIVEVLREEAPGTRWRACRDKFIQQAKAGQG